MECILTQEYKSPIGVLLLGAYKNQICVCDWKYRKQRKRIDERICQHLNAQYQPGSSDMLTKLALQLDEYFNGERQTFDVDYIFCGSAFQKEVWNQLLQIKVGSWISYQQLALQCGDAQKVRAVASANGANALAIIVPCHRVLASDGKLTGYAGGLRAKQYLLKLENAYQPSLQGTLF
ncbi:MAG TPA: methylated-DNA--[protein]-cysteine S-methyltransferase [Bacteroidia bacterium]|nr:methylated-DNA--[protein]-cysteine S-methyltransferase [Bacteroidia bacterium]